MAKEIKHHYVIVRKPNGGLERYPLKQWLREHPEHLPAGMSPDTNNSHELRRALRREGWTLEIRRDEVRLLKPNGDGDRDVGLDDEDEAEEEEYQEEIADAEEITFGLEGDLQLAIRANIDQLEPGLKIIDGGKERATEAGKIDITAIDTEGNIVVIELKAGLASPQVVAQILAYMGTIAESENKPVRGILVAGDFHKRVIFAARATANLRLKKYSFWFTFEPAE
jgi:hypothetical protein